MCGAYGRQKKDSEPLKIVTDGELSDMGVRT